MCSSSFNNEKFSKQICGRIKYIIQVILQKKMLVVQLEKNPVNVSTVTSKFTTPNKLTACWMSHCHDKLNIFNFLSLIMAPVT